MTFSFFQRAENIFFEALQMVNCFREEVFIFFQKISIYIFFQPLVWMYVLTKTRENIIIHACPSAFSQITTELLPHMCSFWYEQKVTSFFYCLNIFDIGDIWINLFCSWCPPPIKKSGLNSIFLKARLKIVFENHNQFMKDQQFIYYTSVASLKKVGFL